MSEPINPWRYMQLIAQAAQECGIRPERAFAFMEALNLLTELEKKGATVAATTETRQ